MPPKKGKGKGKKKKENLTEEQKKKLAEQKALAEQEKIARRREVTNAFLKVKKEKEYELIKQNTNKLLDLWRPRLRKLKIDELMDDYKMMRNAFERAYDKKRNLMKDLRDALDKNQQDYDAAVDGHMYNIDKMMEFWKKRLGEVRDAYNLEKTTLINSLNEERMKIQSYHEQSLRNLSNAMAKVENHFRYQAAESKADFAVREEEIRNKGIEEVHIIKSKMEARMNDMWKDIHDRMVAYDVNVSAKREEYLDYREKDMMMSSLIDSQFRRLHSLQDGIAQMTSKTEMFHKALSHFLEDLMKKRREYRDIYNELMESHRSTIAISGTALRHLALVTNGVHEKMDEMLAQRERLLRCIERCRKRERWDEKIDPFLLKWNLKANLSENEGAALEEKRPKCDNTNQPEADSDIEISGRFLMHVNPIGHQLTCECNPCTCEIEGEDESGIIAPVQQLFNEFSILEKFWIRYNRVALEQAALTVRRDSLLRDNTKLKLALRNYMGGINPGTQDICNIHEEVLVNYPDKESIVFPKSAHTRPENSKFSQSASTSKKQTRFHKLIQPRYVRPPHPGTNVTEGVHIVRTLQKSAKCFAAQKGSIVPFSLPQLAQEHRENQRIFRAITRELKRRERCRKVGGIRVH